MKNKFISFLKREFKTSHIILIFIILLVLCFFAEINTKQTPQTLQIPKDPTSVDTFIPKGFVLVPIEIKNALALESILSSHGVVDLYTSVGDLHKKSKKVASRVKILRAPLNPNQFAVLVKEDLAPHIVQSQEPFFVMVQNPKQDKTQIHLQKLKKRNHIITEIL